MTEILICHIAGGAEDASCRPLYEYARTLTARQRKLGRERGIDAEFFTFDNVDWQKTNGLRRRIDAIAAGREVVLFLHTVFPFVGNAMPLALFSAFPSVLFAHQLELLPEEGRRQTSTLIQYADTVVVTCADEIEAAQRLAVTFGLATPTADFVVVPQPPAFRPVEPIDLLGKSRDIVCFGMLRRGKGLEHVVQLARLLAADPSRGDRHIDVIGHVAPRTDSLALLRDLITATWDLTGAEGWTKLHLAQMEELVEILEGRRSGGPSEGLARCLDPKWVGSTRASDWEPERLRRLPLRLHVSAPRAVASRLLARASYAYLPVEGGELHRPERRIGLTAHSSSAPTVAAHGNVLLAPVGARTPQSLRSGVLVPAKSAAEAYKAIQALDRRPRERMAAAERALAWASSSHWQDVADLTLTAALGSLERYAELNGSVASAVAGGVP